MACDEGYGDCPTFLQRLDAIALWASLRGPARYQGLASFHAKGQFLTASACILTCQPMVCLARALLAIARGLQRPPGDRFLSCARSVDRQRSRHEKRSPGNAAFDVCARQWHARAHRDLLCRGQEGTRYESRRTAVLARLAPPHAPLVMLVHHFLVRGPQRLNQREGVWRQTNTRPLPFSGEVPGLDTYGRLLLLVVLPQPVLDLPAALALIVSQHRHNASPATLHW